MPTEDDLRRMLGAAGDAPNRLDAGAVVRRSRARRLPKQLAAGAIGVLAVAGISVLSVQSLTAAPAPSTMVAGEAYDQSAPAPELDSIKRAPADKINLCTGTLAELSPSPYGLQLDVEFPETAAVGTEPITGTVRLTNTSDREVVGSTPMRPSLTVSKDGTVLWHSNGVTLLGSVEVDLQPGESLTYETTFTPVLCGVEDDLGDDFRAGLPALGAGDYDLSAVIDFTADPSMGQESPELDLVSGPTSTIRLE